ncbi:MAG: ketoacyl-ACP synthase III [Bdellovibrio sp.]|nr:MAG: ketoacyl-ACP synthase III [Bdellovibrio sp.]
MKVKIIGSGRYAPGKPITNEELKILARIEFDADKISGKIGIQTRHVAKLRNLRESTADFATAAASRAIQSARINPADIDLFIVGTDTPEFISPSTAVLVQGRIQKGETWSTAFDLNSSCASFVLALNTAARMLAGDPHLKFACVTGVYNMPAFVHDGDAFSYPIFADGAGSVVLQRAEDGDASGFVDSLGLADGTQWDFIGIYTGGAHRPFSRELIDQVGGCTSSAARGGSVGTSAVSNKYGLESLKPLPGDRNVRLWPMVANKILARANLRANEIDHYIFTQINRSVIEKVMAALGQPMEKTTCIMGEYGYTGSACVPMALDVAIENGRIRRGDKVLLVASGSGLSVGASLFIY